MMTPLAFLEVTAPVLLATLVAVVGIIVLIQLMKARDREAEMCRQLIAHLRCPACGSAYDYDQWRGATWGIDADPPESVKHDHGILLVCPHCHANGYVVEAEGALRVYATVEEASGMAKTPSEEAE